jgi:hypothetical protein
MKVRTPWFARYAQALLYSNTELHANTEKSV